MQRKQIKWHFGKSNVVICWTLLYISHIWQRCLMLQSPGVAVAATVLYTKVSTDYFGFAYMNFAHLEEV
jgi:hypothetical protein